jgi:hypothetical protein
MTTFLVAGFLAVHGLLHLVVWLPKPADDPEHPPPFEPDHSAVLTATGIDQATSHRVAIGLAVGATATYVLAAIAVVFSASWAIAIAVTAALLGLVIKALYFHPWLTIGLLLDLLVLGSALAEWPVAMT